MEQRIITVSEVNQVVKLLLENEPLLRNLSVRGELSNYKIHSTGNHFFTLKDAGGALQCVMFKGAAGKIRFRPENGMKVVATGRISAFPRDGVYQLYCDALIPEGTGDLALAFEQLKARLHAEGLFDPSHKKPLPRYPQRIALVTSGTGAAVRDMIRILRRRYPLAKVIVLPVRVQGAGAAAEIAGAIRYADHWHIGDVIITGRGGGSMEDLWAFNEERVARPIDACQTPVISAVGHEPDVTISDFVADVRASTPSNAAEIAVPDQVELRRLLRDRQARMEGSETARLETLRQRLTELAGKRVMRDQMAYVQDQASALLARKRQRFAALAASLDAMSPLKVLGRGYAMARGADGTILKSWRDVTPGDAVQVTLGEGGFAATVVEPIKEVDA